MVREAILEITWDLEGVFDQRVNRFLGIVKVCTVAGEETRHQVHVHDPGRLKELLYQGNRVLIRKAAAGGRKTQWDLIAARRGREWVLVHTGFHRAIAYELLTGQRPEILQGFSEVRAEVTVEESRLDFVARSPEGIRLGVEVKGCTLMQDGLALFPDAPTSRGVRHLKTLTRMLERGDRACLLVLVFGTTARCFAPNAQLDPAFSSAFHEAIHRGLRVFPLMLTYEQNMIYYLGQIPLC